MNNHSKSVLSHHIKNTFEDTATTPHVLVELSKKEQLRLSSNCIHLNGVTSCKSNGNLIYNSVTYGSNIRKRKSNISFDGTKIQSYEVGLQSMKRSSFIITLEKSDALEIFPELITSASTYNDDPSGAVLLMACGYKPVSKTGKKWDDNDYALVKKCKPNILQNSNHHMSTGYYASFGNKGSYEMINSSSVGQYATKRNTCLAKQIHINNDATKYENLCANEISRSISVLRTIIPNIKSIIAPVLETTYELQMTDCDLNLKEMSSINDGCW